MERPGGTNWPSSNRLLLVFADAGAIQTSQAYLYANTATDYDPANMMRQRNVSSRDSLKTHDLPVSVWIDAQPA